MGSENFDWRPPTDEEMRQIQQRRSRSDRISKLMADFLLRGYRMLDANCPTCFNVMLEEKSGRRFCVACQLDNEAAAASAAATAPPAADSQASSSGGVTSSSNIQISDKQNVMMMESKATNLTGSPDPPKTPAPPPPDNAIHIVNAPIVQSTDEPAMLEVAKLSLLATIAVSATKIRNLAHTQDLSDSCADCANVIRACADALYSLRRLK